MAKENSAVAKSSPNSLSLSDELASEIAKLGEEELGYSSKMDDSLVPILGILQDNSGEVKKKHSKYIEGAEPGDLIIRALGRVFHVDPNHPETEPFIIQPCAFDHVWVEWQGEPGDGYPVGQYSFDSLPPGAEKTVEQDENGEDREIYRMPNGNRLVDTRYHYVHLVSGDSISPLVIPMSGTNHTVSRTWTSLMKNAKMPDGRPMPAFLKTYRLETEFVQRGSQSWYKYRVVDMGMIEQNEALVRAGLELMRAVVKKTVAADIKSEAGAEVGEDNVPI